MGTRYQTGDTVIVKNKLGVWEVIDIEKPLSQSPDYYLEKNGSNGEMIQTRASKMKKADPASQLLSHEQDSFGGNDKRTYKVMVNGKTREGKDATKEVYVEAYDEHDAKEEALNKAQEQSSDDVMYTSTGIPEETSTVDIFNFEHGIEKTE